MIWELQTSSIGTVNTYVIFGVLYLGIVSTAGAFFLWNKGLELIDASIGSLFSSSNLLLDHYLASSY